MPDALACFPALERPDLLAAPTALGLRALPDASEFQVAEIDPEVSDTAATCERYGFEMQDSANCVIIAGKRDGEIRYCACVVRAVTRADVNGIVRKRLDVRKASFAPMDRAVELSEMEYGGITPVGLPDTWPILIDSTVLDVPFALLGSGLRRSKLFAPGRVLSDLPCVEVVEGLGR